MTPSPWYSGERVGVRGKEANAEVIRRLLRSGNREYMSAPF
jgi:hypothetical protein